MAVRSEVSADVASALPNQPRELHALISETLSEAAGALEQINIHVGVACVVTSLV